MSAPAIVDDSILDDAADARACRKIGVRGRKALIAKLFEVGDRGIHDHRRLSNDGDKDGLQAHFGVSSHRTIR